MRNKIKLEPYKEKYFFRFLFGVMNFRTLKNLGIFKPRIFWRVVRNTLFSNSKTYKLMILFNGKIVGGVSLVELSLGTCRVGLFLFKKYRNQNIGTNALKETIKYCKKKGWKKIVAGTFTKNIPAQKVLKSSGFRKIKIDKKDTYWEKELK